MSMYNNSGRYRRSISVANSCSSVDSNDEEDADSEEDYDSNSESAAVLPPPCTLVITRRQKDFGITTTPPSPEKQNITQKYYPRDITVVKNTCVHMKNMRSCMYVGLYSGCTYLYFRSKICGLNWQPKLENCSLSACGLC